MLQDLYGVIIEFKKNYQPRIDLSKDEKGDLLSDLHSRLKSWKEMY